MKRIAVIILASVLACLVPKPLHAQTDSLGLMLSSYLQALEYESIEVQKSECDFLIETCSDPDVRRRVVLDTYDHYLHSPLMGVEAVAIHIFDRWMAGGEIEVPEDIRFGARIFAEFNRNSLVGMKAPALTMYSPEGNPVSLFSGDLPSRRCKVLYFYDTDCPKCFVETTRMPYLLEKDFPVDFYAVYVGVDEDSWKEYRKKFSTDGTVLSQTQICHLWDPEVSSDYQKKYGVLQTPRLFLIDNMGTIAGRGLDMPVLTAMLEEIYEQHQLEYGSERSVEVFDRAFEPYGNHVAAKDIRFVADYIAESTVASGDTLMFKQLVGDMLYYLIPQKGEEWKLGLDDVISRYILSRKDIWNTADDSLKVVGTAQMMEELLSLSPAGTAVPALKVPGRLSRSGRKGKIHEKTGSFNLRRLGGGRNIILFYTEGCEYCKAEKKAAADLLSGGHARGTRVFEINMDEIFSSAPGLAEQIFSVFDLSSLPFILETDRKGTIRRKYLTLIECN